MKKMLKLALQGAAIGGFIFTLTGIVFDIVGKGTFTLIDWGFTKMVIGSWIVGAGFSCPSIVYENENMPRVNQFLIQMGTGSVIMIIVGFVVGWIPTEYGAFYIALQILMEVGIALCIWLIFYLYNRSVAKEMTQKLQELQQNPTLSSK